MIMKKLSDFEFDNEVGNFLYMAKFKENPKKRFPKSGVSLDEFKRLINEFVYDYSNYKDEFVFRLTFEIEDYLYENKEKFSKETGTPWDKILSSRIEFTQKCLEFLKQSRVKVLLPKTKLKKGKKETVWEDLFIDRNDANKIIGLISEHLTQTGQWKEKPIALVALCTVLENKGYFVNSITDKTKAVAFKNKFDMNIDDSLFKRSKRDSACLYEKLFQNIALRIKAEK